MTDIDISNMSLRRIFKLALPGAAGYLPALLSPTATLLSAAGCVYTPHLLDMSIQYMVHTDNATLHSLVTQNSYLFGQSGVFGDEIRQLHSVAAIAASLTGALASFVFLPAADAVLGRDLVPETEVHQPPFLIGFSCRQDEVARMVANPSYRGVEYAYVIGYWVALLGSCHLVATAPSAPPPLAILGLILSMGSGGGIMFSVAHDLLHSKDPMEHFLAESLLATAAAQHWTLSHKAHHAKVATWEDPSTAREGETVWEFVPRSWGGNVVDGYTAEARRLRAKGLPLLSTQNRMIWWVMGPLGLTLGVGAAWGPLGLLLLAGQAMVGCFLLEVINYVQHYGLTRQRLPSGAYERVGVRHSWNCNWLATNSVTFRLQHHSDHHRCSLKPYQVLQDIKESPQLPASYPAMALLALTPALFFAVMDSRVKSAKQAEM